jgi:hypothetical protein
VDKSLRKEKIVWRGNMTTNFTIQIPDIQAEIKPTIQTLIPGDETRIAITIPLTSSTRTTTVDDRSLSAGARAKHLSRRNEEYDYDDTCPECRAALRLGDHWPSCSLVPLDIDKITVNRYNVIDNIADSFRYVLEAEMIIAICGETRYIIKNRYSTSSAYTPREPDYVGATYREAPYYRRLRLRERK